MPSRSTVEWAGIALGAVVQSVWLGALASAFGGAGWPPLSAFAAAVMLAAAAATLWTAADAGRLRRGRLLLAALVLVATAALFAAGRGWAHDFVVWRVVSCALYAGAAALLGTRLGRGDDGPAEAFARAARAFAALCGVLVVAGITATPLDGQAAAVATALVAGGLHVAVLRYRALTDVVAADDRLPLWPWLLSVAATIAAVLVVTGLVASVLGGATVRSVAAGVLAVLGYAGAAIGYVGAGIFWALGRVAGLFDLQVPQREPPQPATVSSPVSVAGEVVSQGSGVLGTALLVVVAAAAVAAAAAVVAVSLRRLGRRESRDDQVVEERESVRSVGAATADTFGGLRRRLRDLVRGGRRHRTSAELVRLRYEQLERRLARAGSPRPPGTTVREHLTACGAPRQPALAGELAAVYELARYSARAVDEEQARRFGESARSFGAAQPGPGPD
jgi:hypothetical protein